MGNHGAQCYQRENRFDVLQADLSFSLELITDVAAFEGLKADWDRLVEDMEFPEIFYAWDWNAVFRRHFRANDDLFVIVVRDAAKAIVAIAPFCVRRTRRLGIAVKVVETIVGGISDYGNILVRKGTHRGNAVSAILDFLRANRERWDVIDLWDFCTRDATTLHIVNLAATFPEWGLRTHVSTPVAVLDLKASAGVENRKEMQRIRIKTKKLLERGFRIHVGVRDLESHWPAYCELHRRTWPSSSFHDPGKQKFYDDLKSAPGLADRLELSLIEIDGRPAAMHFGFVDARKVYYYMPAMDRSFGNDGVGKVLLYAVIEHYRKSHRMLDFMRGMEAYKLWYTDALDLNLRLVIYRNASLAAFAYNLGGLTRRYGAELGLPKAAVRLTRGWARKLRSAA
jgi:hypothetical protein